MRLPPGYGSYRTDQTRLNREHRDGTGGLSQAAVDPDLSAVPVPEVQDTLTRPPLQDPRDLLQQDPECSEGWFRLGNAPQGVGDDRQNETPRWDDSGCNAYLFLSDMSAGAKWLWIRAPPK